MNSNIKAGEFEEGDKEGGFIKSEIKDSNLLFLKKPIDKSSKEYIKNIEFTIIGIIIGIILTPIISPLLAKIIPIIDNDSPTLVSIFPTTNSNIFSLHNITVKAKDKGGSGLDLENSFIKLNGASSKEIKGTMTRVEDLLVYIPKYKLKPDIYTVEVFIKDRANNLEKEYSQFTLLEDPNLRFDLYESIPNYPQDSDVYGIKWKKEYVSYDFAVINEGATSNLKDIEIVLNFPGLILKHDVIEKTRCTNCYIGNVKSKPDVFRGTKTVTNFSTCQTTINIEKLPPEGIFKGKIIIDPQYEQKIDEITLYCDGFIAHSYYSKPLQNLSVSFLLPPKLPKIYYYYGTYFYEQLGMVDNISIEGKIDMNADAWTNKGIFLRKRGLNYGNIDMVKLSLDVFDNAIEISPSNERIFNEKGASFKRLLNFSEAIVLFNKSISINPNFVDPYYNIAEIYSDVGNCDTAISYANKILDIDKTHKNAKELVRACENKNEVIPEELKNKISEINEYGDEIEFVINTNDLSYNKPIDVILLNFTKGNSRYILTKDLNSNLIFEYLSFLNGYRIIESDISNLIKACDAIGIKLGWSKEMNNILIGCLMNIKK